MKEVKFVRLKSVLSHFVFLGLSFLVINTKSIPEESEVGQEAQKR